MKGSQVVWSYPWIWARGAVEIEGTVVECLQLNSTGSGPNVHEPSLPTSYLQKSRDLEALNVEAEPEGSIKYLSSL